MLSSPMIRTLIESTRHKGIMYIYNFVFSLKFVKTDG